MKKRMLIVALLLGAMSFGLCAQEESGVSISADRPGAATGTDVLPFKKVQLEAGFECGYDGGHGITLPTAMLRVGITKFAELRVEYDGLLYGQNHSWSYGVEPLVLGTKVRIFDGSEQHKWLPKTSLLLNLAIPSTKELAETMHVAPSVYLLFQNDVTDWFNIGYNVGAEWNGVDATPATFLALCLGFNITDNLGAYVESYNYFTKQSMHHTDAECDVDFGFSYVVHPRVQLDIYSSFNCQDPKNSASLGLGVAWLIN